MARMSGAAAALVPRHRFAWSIQSSRGGTMHRWKRRDFLRHSAMASLVAPIAAYWNDLPEARAVAARKQMLLVWFCNGDVNAVPVATPTGSGWTFAQPYTAYEKYKQDMIVFARYGY